jgi:hypothetical protein
MMHFRRGNAIAFLLNALPPDRLLAMADLGAHAAFFSSYFTATFSSASSRHVPSLFRSSQ